MKKIVGIMMAMTLLVGCSSAKKTESLKVLTPNGAPALSLLSVYKNINEKGEVRVVEGSDMISSELIKKESEYDAIIAPINLGCQLIAKGKTDYKLAGVLTWGNLYVVENTAVKDQSLAAFGKEAVPGKIFEMVKGSSSYVKDANVTYYNAVSDVQGQVLASKVRYALMAEPAASATIAKAKQNQTTLKVVEDLQELYQKQTQSSQTGYPQAALFVKDKEKTKDLIQSINTFTNQEAKDETIKSYIEEIGVDVFGMPNAQIVVKTWKNQNIHYRDAHEVEKDIEALLKQFGITFHKDMMIS